ncbi:MAG: alpha-L-fucosidase [Verrucomicrobiota bacterium]
MNKQLKPTSRRAFASALILTCSLMAALGLSPSAIADSLPLPESPAQRDARMQWWREARFGMFIHWGLYSVPAGEWQDKTGYGEWFLEETHTPVSHYEKYAEQFKPTKFNATNWVRAAKAAGVKYIVITSKHHDGFALYPSELTDWDIGRTPFKRDPLKELAVACKSEGITFCFYHSIMDWHHPDWGQRRAWNDVATNAPAPDMDRYTAFMKGQLKELLTHYGPIGLLWFDGQWESCWTKERGDDLYRYVRSLQPDIIVNNRVSKPANNARRWLCTFGRHGRLRHARANHSTERFRTGCGLGIVHDNERSLGLQQKRSQLEIHANARAQPD